MKQFTHYILEEFSFLQKNYPLSYQKYKKELVENLYSISPPSFRRGYWKNIDLNFLNQKWNYFHKNPVSDERLTKEYIENLLGEDDYINIIFINGFLYSYSYEEKPSMKGYLEVEKISENHEKLLEKKKEVFSFFQRKKFLKNWFLCFNEILNDEMLMLKLKGNKKLKQPVRLIFITDNDGIEPLTCPQIFFNVEPNSELNLIEEHFSLGRSLNNHSLKFIIGEQSVVRHFLFQNESEFSIHVNHTYVEQKQKSKYYSYVLQKGAKNAVVQKTINHIESESNSELYGLSYSKNQQNISNLTTVEHLVPQTHSQQLYRGILEDEGFLNFSGNVRVSKEAALTDSNQLNQNLIIGEKTSAVSQPRLEIHNDNVKCTHGATCRDANQQELFYLLSRGINPKKCKKLLIEGFAQDFYKHIKEHFPKWKP